jgi:hypothetical protein
MVNFKRGVDKESFNDPDQTGKKGGYSNKVIRVNPGDLAELRSTKLSSLLPLVRESGRGNSCLELYHYVTHLILVGRGLRLYSLRTNFYAKEAG